MKLLTRKDIDYSNINFWYYYVLCFRGFDEQKELNLDDAIKEIIDVDIQFGSFENWYNNLLVQDISGDDQYCLIEGNLTSELRFAIEICSNETIFYLNDIYIGNLGGHFDAWYLTFDELVAFDKFDCLFLLLLPMTGIEKTERLQAESLISKRLSQISLFAKQSDYIAQCIVNGLIVDNPHSELAGVGIVSNTNHSVRNVEKYPRYIDDVIVLNNILKRFVSI